MLKWKQVNMGGWEFRQLLCIKLFNMSIKYRGKLEQSILTITQIKIQGTELILFMLWIIANGDTDTPETKTKIGWNRAWQIT